MKLQSVNPATEELLGEFPGMTFETALEWTKKARAAQKSWSQKSIQQRCVFLKNLAKALRSHLEESSKLMTLEMGKPIGQSRLEVEKCAWLCDFYAEAASGFLAEELVKTDAKKSYVRFDPLGVVLCIMPWNFPFWQVFRFAAPALAAGNTVVLKHASNVPQCALKIEEIFREAGLDEGIFKTLLIDSATASRLIETDTIDAVSLTGSTQAGALVAQQAGKNLKKCVLELGGSDPFIVLADADVEFSCKIALQARTINTGQSCIAAKRFILEKSIAAEFEKKLIEHFKTLKIGDPMDPDVNIGPLAKKEIRDDLYGQVKDAISKGAKVLAGGKSMPGKGYFFEPTLLTNITPNMAVYMEETFGPVMSLFIVENADEALRLANNSEFGLGASIWTKNIELAEKMAAQIESGAVFINGMVKSDPRLPFGGVKKSGFGRELGKFGIREFVNIKTVVVN
ncbi:NAD-dependent succinate-semialdehyde dehydrogenase [Candidatus Peregrinibacteria bacterium]|nr:NAD-dependent succinate-semialdehyde dehydrogenase [Candidatus Peregrinibacteria bacterium]